MDLHGGDEIVYMKVGVHAGESLADILRRKRREIDEAGFAMWGYGGNTCHPRHVRSLAAATGRVTLVMQEIESHHDAAQVRARRYSADGGATWQEVPAGINVMGSRYALCLETLEDVEFDLDLSATRVAVGPSEGRPGRQYIAGRVDKACLRLDAEPSGKTDDTVHISLAAPLVSPFAVILGD